MSFVRSLRCVCRLVPRYQPITRSMIRPAFNQSFIQSRSFQTSQSLYQEAGVAPPPTKAEVQSRVLEVIKKFDKVDPAKVAATSTFKDLGLDSLDGIELVMAFEDEFNIEISDADAEKIQSAQSAIDFIAQQPNLK